MKTCSRMRCAIWGQHQSQLLISLSHLMLVPMSLRNQRVTWSPCHLGNSTFLLHYCFFIQPGWSFLPQQVKLLLNKSRIVLVAWRQVPSRTVTQPNGQCSSALTPWSLPSMTNSIRVLQPEWRQCPDGGYTVGMQVLLLLTATSTVLFSLTLKF